MRIVHVLFLLFIGSFANGQATKSPVITRYIKLTGTIDKFPVTFHLHRANDAFSGKYYYHSSEQPIDISGKLIQTKEVNINSSMQIEEVRIPRSVSGGNYLLKINGVSNKVLFTNKLVVQ